MPRRKRKLIGEDTLNEVDIQNDGAVKEDKPTRKTRSQTSNQNKFSESKKNKSKEDLLLEHKSVTKRAKVLLTKIKVENENHHSNMNHSPESMDSGIGSGLSVKDESYTQDNTEFESRNESDSVEIKKYKGQQQFIKQSNINSDDLITDSLLCSSDKPSASKKKKTKTNSQVKSKKESKTKNVAIKTDESNTPSTSKHQLVSCEFSTKEESVLQVLTRLEYDPMHEAESVISTKLENTDSTSDSDWEEVEEQKEQNLEEYNPVIPKDGVEITIDCPDLVKRKRKKTQFDHMEYIRLYINRERKEHQLNIHKTHLLCLLSHGLYVNDILNSLISKVKSLCLIPPEIETLTTARNMNKIDGEGIKKIVDWFRDKFTFENIQPPFLNIKENMSKYLENCNCLNGSEYNLMLIAIARTLGFNIRFCVSLYPVTYKARNLLKKPGSKKQKSKQTDKLSNVEDTVGSSEGPSNLTLAEEKTEKSIMQVSTKNKKKKLDKKSKSSNSKQSKETKDETSSDESDQNDEDFILENSKSKKKLDKTRKRPTSKRSRKKKNESNTDESDKDDDDFILEKSKSTKRNKTMPNKVSKRQSNRKILSSDSDPGSPIDDSLPLEKVVCWLEIFCKKEKQWISVECVSGSFNDPFEIEKQLPQPVTYILAFDNKSFVKDLTRRYCSEYMTSTLKMRIDPDWWEETLDPFSPPKSKLDKEEEKKLDEMMINKPLPKTIAEYKNHPLYALKRHLLKFEGIYPPDAAPVGFFRSEPVYARECVCQLHSRETWLKEARVVRIGEEPYKIVKARPKWDRLAGVMRTDLPLDIFGFWQTQPYEPPTAVGGKVPRNEYGNVELFKPCMLPKGTVHLQIPGLNRVAKKLGIDCSPAVVGFDGHKGSIHPVFDGFVVCKEYKNTLLEAWDEDQENARKREEEKREKHIYGNWKKLIRGLLIREKIKLKYYNK